VPRRPKRRFPLSLLGTQEANHQEQLLALRLVLGSPVEGRRLGRAAIKADHARYVQKRIPPGVLPRAAWHMLVEGGTGLRRGDLLWAATALAAHLHANPNDLPNATERWAMITDWLRGTRLKPEGPWPMVYAEAAQWHHRDAIRKKRREARVKLRGKRPPRKPFLTFGDGYFAVRLKGDEATTEGAASAHCMSSATPGEHFSVRTDKNLPIISATFERANKGITLVETKGNWNRLPSEHMAQARGAWRAVVAKEGKITEIRSADDFLALWFPRPIATGWDCLCDEKHMTVKGKKGSTQGDHVLSRNLGTVPAEQLQIAFEDMLDLATPQAVSEVIHRALGRYQRPSEHRTTAHVGPSVAVVKKVWLALVKVDLPAAVAWASSLSEAGEVQAILGCEGVPDVLRLALRAREIVTQIDPHGSRTLGPVPQFDKATAVPLRSALLKQSPRMEDALWWYRDSSTLSLWLALAPQREVVRFFRWWSSPKGLYGLAAASSNPPPSLHQGIVAARARRLSKRDLRAFLNAHTEHGRTLAATRVEAASFGVVKISLGDIERGVEDVGGWNIVSGPTLLSRPEVRVQSELRRMPPAELNRLVKSMRARLNDCIYALDPNEEREEDSYDAWTEKTEMAHNLTASLWWLINVRGGELEPKALLEATSLASLGDSLITEGYSDLSNPTAGWVVDAVVQLALVDDLSVNVWDIDRIAGVDELLALALHRVVSRHDLPVEIRSIAAGAIARIPENFGGGGEWTWHLPFRWLWDVIESESDAQKVKEYADEHGMPYGQNLQEWVNTQAQERAETA
jgi:hypothetical protein